MMKCAGCGKEVEKVCSNCWRCSECKRDCPVQMERTINGEFQNKKD